jgi:hypothetical protein
MSPVDRLRWAIAPDQRRSLWIMYGGIAAFGSLAGLAILLEPPRAVVVLMGIPIIAAWLVAACGVVGYLRWFFAAEVREQKRR